ncbi:MAG: FAD-binding oxidoreductase, partial [Sporichthyaceae bacterium]|nr:FAD-binding oxidoreductase [Sporichthyaceae bacterium]
MIDQLRKAVNGAVITPEDPTYDKVRTVVPGDVDGHPAAIVRVTDSDDVARVVDIARYAGAELAVRSGGHSGPGHGTTDGGIVIDLRDLNRIEFDLDARTAWADGGVTAADYTNAAGEHGLATGFGDTGSVGVSGLTLGGGIGFLVRKFGLTIDSLLAAEIVTADGERRTVDADHEPDLFWAIRGGGGNFGVVTRLRFQLHDVPQIVGGMMILPATAETVEGFIAEAERAPDELSTIANVMPCPPMPFAPESVHGKLVIFGMLTYAGDVEAGQQVLDRFRGLATPIADMTQAMPYSGMYFPEEEYHPLAVAKTMFIDRVDGPTASVIMDRLERSDAAMRVAQLRVLGGAMARVPDDATAFAHRSSRIMANVAAFYEGPDDRAVRQEWVEELSAALPRDGRMYVNFLLYEG